MVRVFGVAVVILAAIGCGGEKGYYCDFRNAPSDAEDRCQERTNTIPGGGEVAKQAFFDTCDLAMGASGSGGCPLDGAVAGCDSGTAGAETVVEWFYGDTTPDEVEANCTSGDLILP